MLAMLILVKIRNEQGQAHTEPADIGPQEVPRTSPPTSPGRPLKILFDHPGVFPS